MINTLIALSYPVGYLVVGLLLARAMSVRIYRWRWDRNVKAYGEYTARADAGWESKLVLLALTVFWPLGAVVALGIGASRFVMAPVQHRRDKAEQLRKDAEYWELEARNENDSEKRRMARELSKSLREQAKGVDVR